MTMTPVTLPRPRGRLALGVLLVAAGLVWTLGNLGYQSAVFGRTWPLLAIAAGAYKLRQSAQDGQPAVGVALIAVGVFLQIQQLPWPMVLLFIGCFLLWRAFARRVGSEPPIVESPVLSELAFIGGANRVVRTPSFRGGYITVVAGGIEVDLRRSSITSSPAFVDVFALWGGIEIRVPADWVVDAKGVPLIGGFEDKTQAPTDGAAAPRIVVRGYALMGGVEITN